MMNNKKDILKLKMKLTQIKIKRQMISYFNYKNKKNKNNILIKN